MSATWLMVALICTSKYAHDCRLETTIYPTRQECIDNGLLERRDYPGGDFKILSIPNRYCSGPNGNAVGSDSEEVLRMQKEHRSCVGLCTGYNPNFEYNIETNRMEQVQK